MLYIDEKFPTHPKVLKAGELLGKNGGAQVVALYIAGLSYAREQLTDGFIPIAFLKRNSLVTDPKLVANVLARRSIKLWEKCRGGYRIHDYHHWNRSASETKELREKERVKKAAQRAAKNNGHGDLSLVVSRGDRTGTSRARARSHDPLRKIS